MAIAAKRIVIGSVCLLSMVFVFLNVIAYNHAYAMTHFTMQGTRTANPEHLKGWHKLKTLFLGINLPRPTGVIPAQEIAPDCRPLVINAPDGIRLSGWYCDRGCDTPLVILFHGYSAEKSSLAEEAKAFLFLGVSILLVDFRGSGESSEAYTTIGIHEADDVSTVVRYADTHLNHTKTVLFGQSMGAAAILRAVNHNSVAPDAVILEAVFDTMLCTVRNRFASMNVPSFPSAQLLIFWGGLQWGFNGFRHNPVDDAAALRCPALFMHGTDDPRATWAEGRRVFDAAPGMKQFKTFSGIGHESYVSRPQAKWLASVEAFLRDTRILQANYGR